MRGETLTVQVLCFNDKNYHGLDDLDEPSQTVCDIILIREGDERTKLQISDCWILPKLFPLDSGGTSHYLTSSIDNPQKQNRIKRSSKTPLIFKSSFKDILECQEAPSHVSFPDTWNHIYILYDQIGSYLKCKNPLIQEVHHFYQAIFFCLLFILGGQKYMLFKDKHEIVPHFFVQF